MVALLNFSWILIALASTFTILNFLTIRVIRYREDIGIDEKVSILLPLRNEAENVEGVIHSLITQEGLLNLEIIHLMTPPVTRRSLDCKKSLHQISKL